MKRIFFIISALAVVSSLAACAPTSTMTPEEQMSYFNAKEQERIEASNKIEEEILEEMENVDDEIGKTEKNKKVVLERVSETGTTKKVIYMDKKGKVDHIMIYQFFKETDQYELMLGAGDNGDDRIVDHDDKKRLIVYKNTKTEMIGMEYELVYNRFKNFPKGDFKLVE